MDSPILITGIQRSGSSIVAKALSSFGIFTGETSSMHENIQIRHRVNDLYRIMNAPINAQFPLPKLNSQIITKDWAKEIEKELIRQGYSKGMWLFKSSTICQIWPIWNYAFPNAKWIVVRRKSEDIVNSCMKTAYMNAFCGEEAWYWWIGEHERLFENMKDAKLNIREIWPEKMLNEDYSEFESILNWLEIPFKKEKICESLQQK